MLLVNQFVVRLLSYSAGTLLCVFLLAIIVKKHRQRMEDWLLAALLAAAGAWQVTHALPQYLVAVGGRPLSEVTLPFLAVQMACAALVPAFLSHLSLLWAGFPRPPVHWLGVGAYSIALLAWSGYVSPVPAWSLALLVPAAILLYAQTKAEGPPKRFYILLALWLAAISAAAWWRGGDSALLAAISLAPLALLIRYIYRFQIFDLLISRRILFVFTLAFLSAAYLVIVRFLAGWLETRLEAFGPLVEISLIFGAVVTWLPIYEITTRFFSRSGRIYAEFGRRVIEEAARILDVQGRAQYFVEQLARTFHLRRAALVRCSDPPEVCGHGMRPEALESGSLNTIAQWLESERQDMAHVTHLRHAKGVQQALAANGFNYLFALRCQDRLTGFLLLDTTPQLFLDENETVLLGLSREISLSLESCQLLESKIRLETELLEQEHLATLGKVAATIAHEVKNPLSSIKTLAQLLREDAGVRESYDRDLHYMISETDRLDSCVQQLLTYARPLPAPAREVDLTEQLESAATFLSRQSAQQGVRIQQHIAAGLKLAQADPQTVQQIVMNLLLNAIQASPPEGSVLLDAERDERGRIRLRVTDEGPGIPAEMRERVFEPFFTTKQQGTGLGLAIVKKNAGQLRAALSLESPVSHGRGTRISVLFPAESR